jgi:hypothetical protein
MWSATTLASLSEFVKIGITHERILREQFGH